READIGISTNLAVSDHAHVIFAYHLEEERLSEQAPEESIGTTGRGIGACYQDKVGRVCGVRLGDLLYPDHLRERLHGIVARKNRILKALAAEAKTFDAETLCDQYLGYAEQMRPFIIDTSRLLQSRSEERRVGKESR